MKLVRGFEDKVKNVLVGISQQNEQILEPIIEQLEQEDGNVSKQIEEQSDLGADEVMGEYASAEPPTHMEFLKNGWSRVKDTCLRNYQAIMSPQVKSLQLDKFEFGVYTVVISVLACSVGSLITLVVNR